jgi:hypothetical protein
MQQDDINYEVSNFINGTRRCRKTPERMVWRAKASLWKKKILDFVVNF